MGTALASAGIRTVRTHSYTLADSVSLLNSTFSWESMLALWPSAAIRDDDMAWRQAGTCLSACRGTTRDRVIHVAVRTYVIDL